MACGTVGKACCAPHPFQSLLVALLAPACRCDISLLVQGGAAPMHPNDSQYGALRFALRCEDPKRRWSQQQQPIGTGIPAGCWKRDKMQ